jgi:murein hydrolase activator
LHGNHLRRRDCWLAGLLGILEAIYEGLTGGEVGTISVKIGDGCMNIGKTAIALLAALGLLIGPEPGGAQEIATILVPDLRMRSGPGTDYRIIAGLEKGVRVTILGRDNGWLQIEKGRRQGYVIDRDDFVAIVHQPEAGKLENRERLKDSTPGAETVHRQLRQAQSDLDTISRKEKTVLDEFNTAEEALNLARQQVRATQTEVAAMDARISEIEDQSRDLERALSTGEAYAAKRLLALYKLNWLGRIHLLATADSFFDFIHRRSSLQRILAQDDALLEALNNDKIALEALLTQLNAKKAEKRSLQLTLKDRIDSLSDRQERRRVLLEKIRGEKKLEVAALTALRQAAANLDTAVMHIEPSVQKFVPSAEKKSEDKMFDAYKGLLSWPVRGKIISFFGPHRDKEYAVTNFQSGINIRAERGEPIRCVADGYTIFSNWFKGFGNMMIIDHGDHYYTVYAHLEEVFKVKGDRVEKNEVIATVGDSGSLMGPALHFEVRYHGKPVDPMDWIRKG